MFIVQTTTYHINNNQGIRLKIVVVADLHDREYTPVLEAIRSSAPDMIAAPGDLMNRSKDRKSENYGLTIPDQQKYALDFLADAAEIAPTFYSLGNHERFIDDTFKNAVQDAGCKYRSSRAECTAF